jgi:hypothetical protein
MRALEKCPTCGSAYHGGIIFCDTASLIAPAHGRTSSYVSIENGPASPGRWQLWQFFCRIGATSLVNVGPIVIPTICPNKDEAKQVVSPRESANLFMAVFSSAPFYITHASRGRNAVIRISLALHNYVARSPRCYRITPFRAEGVYGQAIG